MEPRFGKDKLLALPEGDNPKAQWLKLQMRMLGIPNFGLRIEGPTVRTWEYFDSTNPNDPYKYQTREPDLRYVSLDWYVGWWKRDKEWYPDLEDWIDAKSQIQQFHRLDLQLLEMYRRRHFNAGKAYIQLAHKSIEAAPAHLDGFQRDHEHQVRFIRSGKTPFAQRLLERYGIVVDPEDLPDRPDPVMRIPEHRGIKQLTILLDKTSRTDEALNVCRMAIDIGWPGDWERRIERYTKRMLKARDSESSKLSARRKRSVHRFCTQCGELLEPQDLFCGHCGSKRK